MSNQRDKKVILEAKKLIADGMQSEAISLLMPIAENGNDEGEYIIGEAYLFGEGVDKDYDQAFMWLTCSYKQSNAKAAIRLATLYDPDYIFSDSSFDQQCKKIKDKALSNKIYQFGFKKLVDLAKIGNKEAMSWVGMCYEAGWGVDVDIDAADTWYNKAI